MRRLEGGCAGVNGPGRILLGCQREQSYTNFGAAYTPRGFDVTETFDFSAIGAVEGQSQVFVRIVFNGATSSNANRANTIDNVQFSATAIPAPGSIALLGLAGLIGFRRRRRA